MSASWPIARVADLCERVDYGYTASASAARVGPSFLRITDIVNGPIDWNRVPFCEISLDIRAKYELRHGDIVIARTGATTGASAYISDPQEAVFASYLVRLRARADTDARFLAYFLRSPEYDAYVRGVLGDKSAQPNASARTLTQARLRVPPLNEQKAIGLLLGALDDKIGLNRRMNETLEALCRALFTRTAEGATTALLGNLVEVNGCKRDRSYQHRVIEYVEISSVSRGRLESTARHPIGTAPGRAQRLVRDGDTIWSCVRPNRRSYAFIDTPPENLVVSTGFATLSPTGVPSAYLYFAATSDEFVDYLTANADGSAYPAVKPDHFAAAEIPLAATDEIRAFESIARPALARMAHNERESRTLAALRDALLPKLISGELRIRDAERTVERAP